VKTLDSTFEAESLQAVTADWQAGKRHTAMSMHWCNLTIPLNISDKIRISNLEKAEQIDAII